MDPISYGVAAKQKQRIEKVIAEPDSTSGVITVPQVIATGETITVPAGRVAVLPNVQVDGTLNVQGDVFIPSGATMSKVVEKVASIDNAVVRFNGTTGEVQNSGVVIDDSGNVGIGVTPSAWISGYNRAIELGTAPSNGTIWSALNENHSHIGIGANFYMDSFFTARYKASYAASQYEQVIGNHYWRTAPSGTAGSPITWTTQMTLNTNGNLLVGTTTDNGVDKLQVNGSISSGTINVYSEGDLNNFKYITQVIGTYPGMANSPLWDHGYLEIIVYSPDTWVMQRWTGLGAVSYPNGGRVFVRVLTPGATWTPWVEK